MTALASVSAFALVLAAAALLVAWRTAKRLARLSESYWELRYAQGQLASRLDAAETDQSGHDDGTHCADAGRATAFVPLSSLKRRA